MHDVIDEIPDEGLSMSFGFDYGPPILNFNFWAPVTFSQHQHEHSRRCIQLQLKEWITKRSKAACLTRRAIWELMLNVFRRGSTEWIKWLPEITWMIGCNPCNLLVKSLQQWSPSSHLSASRSAMSFFILKNKRRASFVSALSNRWMSTGRSVQ